MVKQHGTATGYKAGCRCADCREAKRVEMAQYVAKVKGRDGVSPTQKYRPAKIQRRFPSSCSKCGKSIRASLAEPLCAACRGNRRGYNIKLSRAGRLAIYERDSWTCSICQEAVDPDAPSNTTWDATLDHIVPRSQGGTDDPANLRLAHRWCNSVRGDLRFHADDDLRIP